MKGTPPRYTRAKRGLHRETSGLQDLGQQQHEYKVSNGMQIPVNQMNWLSHNWQY